MLTIPVVSHAKSMQAPVSMLRYLPVIVESEQSGSSSLELVPSPPRYPYHGLNLPRSLSGEHRTRKARKRPHTATYGHQTFKKGPAGSITSQAAAGNDADSPYGDGVIHQHASTLHGGRASGKRYERRPRHRTRADRYELNVALNTAPRQTRDSNDRRAKKHSRRKKGSRLEQEYKAPNVPPDRLTVIICAFGILSRPCSGLSILTAFSSRNQSPEASFVTVRRHLQRGDELVSAVLVGQHHR